MSASTAQIAHAQKITPPFLAKIIAQLSVAGIVHATRGTRGGVRLARPVATISLLEIVEAVDGPISLNEYATQPETCTLSADSPIQQVWGEAQAELIARLAETKFSQWVQQSTPRLPSEATGAAS
jgi:Rrf2 family protein